MTTSEVVKKMQFGLGETLNDLQIESVYAITRHWRRLDKYKDENRLAYILATAWHESKLEPVRELRFRSSKGKERKNQDRYWLTGYYGRGFVQLTWLTNYRKQAKKMNLPLVENPDLALRLEIAAEILVRGMLDGDFTSRKLSRYINSSRIDFKEARRVVNGTDRKELIAEYAEKIK